MAFEARPVEMEAQQEIAPLPKRSPQILAAVDLGSSSFRMVIARVWAAS